MSILIKSTVSRTKIVEWSNLLREQEIYENPDWIMNQSYIFHIYTKCIAVAYVDTITHTGIYLVKLDRKIAGAALLSDYYDINHINVYVRPEYRRQGIGSALTKTIIRRFSKQPIKYFSGIDGSLNFYQGIRSKKLKDGYT